MCVGALDVLAHHARRPRAVVRAHRAHQSPMLLVGGVQHRGRVRDVRDQVRHLALRRGHRGDQPRAAGALGQPDVEAHVGAAVCRVVAELPVHRLDQRGERVKRLRIGTLGRQHRHPDLERHAAVADLVPLAQQLSEGSSVGGWGSATNVPPRRPRVACRWPVWPSARSAWRSVERAIPSLRHSSRSAGSRVPGREQPELDRGAQPLDGLLERRLRADRREDRVLADRRRDAHSRSKPRYRSQSVTALPNAASSTSAALT